MKRKSVFSSSVAAVLLMSMLTACASSSAPSAETTSGAATAAAEMTGEQVKKEPAKITALVQQSRNYEGLQKMIEKLKTDENITVDVQVVPDGESLNMIKMKLNSGEAPDLIDYNVPAIYSIIDPQQNFADLSDCEFVKRMTIPENTMYTDGKVYGFRFLSVNSTHGFIYNKDVFEQCGVTKVPETWDELLTACEKIKAAGVTPLFIPKDTWVPQIFMTDNFVKALGQKESEDFAAKVLKNEIKWTDVPEFAEVIDKYLDLYNKGYVNSDFASAVYDDSLAAIADGTSAMIFNGNKSANAIVKANPDVKVGFFPLSMTPGVDFVTENMSSPGFVVYKNSKNLDTVKRVLDLWSTPEYANLYFEGNPGFPAFKDVDGGMLPEYLAEVNEKYISKGKAVPEFNYYTMPINALCDSTLYVYYIEAPAKGNMDGAAIMEKFQRDFEQYMQDQGVAGF